MNQAGKRVSYQIARIRIAVDEPLHNIQLQRADVHLLAASALAGVECAHAVYVVPYGHVPAAGCYHHKGGRQAAVFVEFLGSFTCSL